MLEKIKNHWPGMLGSIALAELTGAVSGLLSGNIKLKYSNYNQPAFSPPDWLFGIAWPILYFLMGLAFYLFRLAAQDEALKRKGTILYATQLFLNFMWSIVFFRWDMLIGSLITILVLDVLVIYTMYIFKKADVVAFQLMIPYILWLFFATYLTAGIVMLN